jgi:hydroxymethylglutaryl-CoA lyase
MADSEQVMKEIQRKDGVSYPVLTPNIIGYERAKLVDAKEVGKILKVL